jgi:hypothetical protein
VGVVVICDGIISDGNSSYEEEEEIGRGYCEIMHVEEEGDEGTKDEQVLF